MNETAFEIRYANRRIINSRLITFIEHEIAALTADNSTGKWNLMLSALQGALSRLKAEKLDVAMGIGQQRGDTQTVKGIVANFHLAMSEEYPFIAKALGGKTDPRVLRFYPDGMEEYHKPTREAMGELVVRVWNVTETYKTLLPDDTVTRLKSFKDLWERHRNEQVAEIEDVDTQRTERDEARRQANIVCHRAEHQIADAYPGDVDKCMSLCDFSLLFKAAPHKKGETKTGTIPAGETVVIFNKSYTADSRIEAGNESDNADYFIYVAATTTSEPDPGKGKEVKSLKNHHFEVKELGDVENTFIIIKNLSAVNPVSYKVVLK